MIYAIAALVFGSVALVVYATFVTVFSEERQVSRRLRDMGEWEGRQAQEVEPLLRPFGSRVVSPMAGVVRDVSHALAPSGYMSQLRHKITLAGTPNGMDAERLVAIKIVATLGVGGLFTGLAVLRSMSGLAWVLLGIPLTVLAFLGPDLWLSSRVQERQTKIRVALPDMLDMLTISVEAGLGFDAAISKLVRNSSGPLAHEFARLLKEIQAGVSRADALRNLSARTEVSELNAFIMAIIQAEVFGISISGVLRTQAAEMRIRRRQRAEEIAQKAPVKLVFPLVLCILPATLIVILGPALVSMFRIFG